MNSENSKAPDPHRLLLDLLDKIDLRRSDNYVALSNLIKTHTIKINLEYQLPRGIKNWNCLMDHILYQTFKIISSVSSKNMKN